jgi:serine protease AprX
MDDNGHGTHVTGIAVGKGLQSENQFVGVAPNAKYYSFKVLDQNGEGNFSTYYNAMMKALDPDNDGDFSDKVDIVSLSFGTKEPGSPDDNLCEILDNIVDAGITVVAAAGNLGPDLKTITSPGCARKSICVGSTSKNDVIASSSSRGPVEWSGNMIEKPDIVAPGVSITSTSKSGGYEINSGTSMATPHISGTAALLLQVYPELSPTEIKQKLMESSKDIGYEKNIQGKGRIDIFNAIKPNKQMQIIAPEIVSEAEIFKIQILDSNDTQTRVWNLLLIPFHIPRLKFGHSRRFVAPMIISKNKESVKGTIFAFKFRGGFEIVKKDIIVLNKIRVKN